MKEFTKEESKILKGIALLFIVCLHLYNRYDYMDGFYKPLLFIKGQPLIFLLSFICDACVPIYCFCAGYAAYLKSLGEGSNLKRLLNLLKVYWIIVILTCILGWIFNNESIPKNIITFLGNISLIKITYVGAWWFIQTYFLLMLTSKYIIKLIDKNKPFFILVISICIYFIAYYFRMMHVVHFDNVILEITRNAAVLYGTSVLSFVVGMLFYKYKLITLIRNNIKNHQSIIGGIIILLAILIHIVIKSMIIAPFTAYIFIVGFSLLHIEGIIKKVLLFFGTHSTNMWLVHMQFYSIFFKNVVFSTNTVIGCLIILLIMCIVTSYFINFIIDSINSFINWITSNM